MWEVCLSDPAHLGGRKSAYITRPRGAPEPIQYYTGGQKICFFPAPGSRLSLVVVASLASRQRDVVEGWMNSGRVPRSGCFFLKRQHRGYFHAEVVIGRAPCRLQRRGGSEQIDHVRTHGMAQLGLSRARKPIPQTGKRTRRPAEKAQKHRLGCLHPMFHRRGLHTVGEDSMGPFTPTGDRANILLIESLMVPSRTTQSNLPCQPESRCGLRPNGEQKILLCA